MVNITNTIEQVIYGYDKAEFMPIFEDGELANRREFVAYKLGKLTSPAHDKMLTVAKGFGLYMERSFHQGTFIPSQQLIDGDEIRLR